jgi:hypothetical protein
MSGHSVRPFEPTLSTRAWSFELVRAAEAAALSAQWSVNAFQNPRWVQAVAAARRVPHEFVAVRATHRAFGRAYLFASLHRRAGVAVFESMPMGGHGGWVAEPSLEPTHERSLAADWLAQAPWTVVVLTSAPGRAAALPDAREWPLPAGWARRFAPRDLQTHVLDLAGDDATLLQRVRPAVRSYLRRVDALGFAVECDGRADALARFCAWYRRGSVAWQQAADTLLPDAFFAALRSGGEADVWCVSRDGQPVGAALFLLGRMQVQYQASGTEKIAGPVSAMDALLWTAARHYRDRGWQSMNLGASEGLEGVRRFKEKFGAQAVDYRRVSYLLPCWAARLRRSASRGGPS